jgi:hypothetical protein
MSFADQNDADTDFDLKTDHSKRVYDIVKGSVVKSCRRLPKLNFLVFGPGIGSAEYQSHRLAVKNMIIDQKEQVADLPEEIPDEETNNVTDPSSPSVIKKILGNPATKELTLAKHYDFLIIVMMSAGSIAEFPIFVKDPILAPKIRLFIPEIHANSNGFAMRGPVKVLKDAYDKIETFKDAGHLRTKVCETVEDLMVLRFYQLSP